MEIIHLYKKVLFITTFLFCFLHNNILSAQNSIQIESLNTLMDSYKYNDAIKLADTYLASDSTNSKIIYYKGKAQSAIYLYRNAIISYTKAYGFDSLNIDFLQEITKTYQLLGDDEKAINYCRKIIDLQPDNYFFKVQLANIYYSNLNYIESKNTVLPIFINDTSNIFIVKLIGNCYTELKKYDSAIYYYNKAIELMPFDAFICQKLANLYIKTKEYDKALTITDNYLKKDANNADVLLLNGYCLYLLKDYFKAVDQLKRSNDLRTETKFLYKYIGLSLYKLEFFGSAEKYLTLAFQKDTTDAEICFYKGVSTYKSLNADTGLLYLNKTMNLIMPTTQFLTTVYLEKAEAYNHLSKYDTALLMIKKAYEVDSTNSTVIFRMAYQYDSWMNDQKQAIVYYEKYLKMQILLNNAAKETPVSESTISFVNGRLEELYKKEKS